MFSKPFYLHVEITLFHSFAVLIVSKPTSPVPAVGLGYKGYCWKGGQQR